MTARWADARAPGLDEIDALTRAAFDELPAQFRALCGDVVIHVAEFAEEEALKDLQIDNPFDLTGLYEGVDITRRSLDDIPAGPNHIHLYRQPLLAEWIEDGRISLGSLIRHVLVHEIGHHFGLSDEDMDLIENTP